MQDFTPPREVEALIHAVGKLAADEGEGWRLRHPELMDAYQAAVESTFKIERVTVLT